MSSSDKPAGLAGAHGAAKRTGGAAKRAASAAKGVAKGDKGAAVAAGAANGSAMAGGAAKGAAVAGGAAKGSADATHGADQGAGGAAEGADALAPTQMRRREQQIGFVLAGVGAAGALSVGIAGQAQPWLSAVGVVAAIVFTLAVRRGHRIMTAVAGFVTGLAVSYIVPLQLGFLFYSGYLMMRTSNAQGKARRAQGPITPAQRREMAAARAAARAQRRRGPAAAAPVVTKTPPPNRRYTPPKAKPTRRP